MAKEQSEAQKAVLKEHAFKPGQTGNPNGVNGWTKLRERYRHRLAQDADDLTDVLIKMAKEGDVQAMRLALGPIVDVRSIELSGPDGAPINFNELAGKAREEGDG